MSVKPRGSRRRARPDDDRDVTDLSQQLRCLSLTEDGRNADKAQCERTQQESGKNIASSTSEDMRKDGCHRPGDMKNATSPTSGDMKNAASPTSGDMKSATSPTSGDMKNATSPTSGDMKNATSPASEDMRKDECHRPGDMKNATSPTSGYMKNAASPASGDMKSATSPTSGDMKNATSPTSGDMKNATSPTSGDMENATSPTSGDTMNMADSKNTASPTSGDMENATSPTSGDVKNTASPVSGDKKNATFPTSTNMMNTAFPSSGDKKNTSFPTSGDVKKTTSPTSADMTNTGFPSSGDKKNTSSPTSGDVKNEGSPYVQTDSKLTAEPQGDEKGFARGTCRDHDVEFRDTTKLKMELTGLTSAVSTTDLTGCLAQVMSAPVKISPSYEPGEKYVTFDVISDKTDVDWQDVVQKLKAPGVSSVIGAAQLRPVTDCVSVAWLADSVTWDYLELYLTNPTRTSMPDTCNVSVLYFNVAEKTAVVQFKETSATDLAGLCNNSHILNDKPLTINPWFGSVADLSGALSGQMGSSKQHPRNQSREENASLEPIDQETEPELHVNLREWKRTISRNELPCYRLIQKLWGSSVRNIVINTNEKTVLIHGTEDQVMALKESLQSQMEKMSGLRRYEALSPAMVTVLKQAGGEEKLENLLAEEDIIATAYINFEPPSVEFFVSTDSAEAEAALTHILQRKVIQETVHLAQYPGLKSEDEVRLICDSLNVAAEFYHDGSKQLCDIKVQGFRQNVQKAVQKLLSKFTEILLPDHFNKLTGAELYEVEGVSPDRVSQKNRNDHCMTHNRHQNSQPLGCTRDQLNRSRWGTESSAGTPENQSPRSTAQDHLRPSQSPVSKNQFLKQSSQMPRANQSHREMTDPEICGIQPLRSNHSQGHRDLDNQSAQYESQRFGRGWESRPNSSVGRGSHQTPPEHRFEGLNKSSPQTKEFRYSESEFPPLGSTSKKPEQGSGRGGMSEEEEQEMGTIQESLAVSGLRYIEKYDLLKWMERDLRKIDGHVEFIKELKEIKWTFPVSQESKVASLKEKFCAEFITKHHRMDIGGIYQFFTDSLEGKNILKDLETSHRCTIEVCKLKAPTSGVPVTDASAGLIQPSTQKTGRKAKFFAQGKRYVNILKKGAQSLRRSGKKGSVDKTLTEEYTFGNLKVVIWQGDIIKSHAAVLVNVLTPDMSLTSGLCKVICDAGGFNLKQALRYNQYKIKVGEVFSTRAHQISTSDFIYHAVLPQSGGAGDRHVISKVIGQALCMADHHLSRSVAFPALGCGGCGYPASLVAEEFINSLINFVCDKAVRIQEVKLCIFDISTFQAFKDQFDAAADDVKAMLAPEGADKENGEGKKSGGTGLERDGAMCDITCGSEYKMKSVKGELDRISRKYQREQAVEEEKMRKELKKRKD